MNSTASLLSKVERGRYENAGEVVRAALRALDRDECEYEANVEALRTAIEEGDASGPAEAGFLSGFARRSICLRYPVTSGGRSSLAPSTADLLAIAAYTLRTWRSEQAVRYLGELAGELTPLLFLRVPRRRAVSGWCVAAIGGGVPVPARCRVSAALN